MKEKEAFEIDILQILSVLWEKKIVIAIVSLAAAVVSFVGAALFTVPRYQSDILIYVNNNSISLGGTSLSFSSGEITAARQLLDTYLVALKSRSCLNAVIEKAALPYSRETLNSMISASSVNDTEWFKVAVTSTIPEEARVIADTIAEVLPDLLSNTIKGSSVEVVDFAIKPEKKVSPGYGTYALYGFIIGFVLIAGIFSLQEILNDKIHNEETLSEIADSIPLLAYIPVGNMNGNQSYNKYGYGYNKKSKKSYKKKKRNNDTSLPLCGDLDFASDEAYKLLQKSVQYSFDKDGCKVIGITSSERKEGKSSLAINLSYTLSCDKQKVLLIDGDMRLPSIAKKLGIDSDIGLSDYLTGRAKNADGIRFSEKAPALSVICAGTLPPNPFVLLGSASMERLIAALKESFDYIIIDLPPVNIVSDPLAVAHCLDGFIVEVRSEFSTRQGIKDVVDKLQIVDSNIFGFVLTGSGTSSENKYGKYTKYSKYGKYTKYGYSYHSKAYEKSYDRVIAKNKSANSVSIDKHE